MNQLIIIFVCVKNKTNTLWYTMFKMRKILLYFFLFTYALVVFKPYTPYFTDAVAHILFFKDHIETVHSHQGKSHVHAEVNKLAKNEQSDKNNTSTKKDIAENDHLVLTSYQYPPHKISIDWQITLSLSPKNKFAEINLPPPKV